MSGRALTRRAPRRCGTPETRPSFQQALVDLRRVCPLDAGAPSLDVSDDFSADRAGRRAPPPRPRPGSRREVRSAPGGLRRGRAGRLTGHIGG